MDYRALSFGKTPYAFFAAITGTIGVIGVSCIIEKCFLKKLFCFWGGQHSLFIMETHEYFMIKSALGIVLCAVPAFSRSWGIIETLGLLGIEVVLIRKIEPILNKVCKKIEEKI